MICDTCGMRHLGYVGDGITSCDCSRCQGCNCCRCDCVCDLPIYDEEEEDW